MAPITDWNRDDTVILHRVPTDGAPSYDEYRAASLTLLDMLQPPIAQKKVTLKPNVVYGVDPNSGISVHPGFMRGIIDHLTARGFAPGSISMAEGGGGEGPERRNAQARGLLDTRFTLPTGKPLLAEPVPRIPGRWRLG